MLSVYDLLGTTRFNDKQSTNMCNFQLTHIRTIKLGSSLCYSRWFHLLDIQAPVDYKLYRVSYVDLLFFALIRQFVIGRKKHQQAANIAAVVLGILRFFSYQTVLSHLYGFVKSATKMEGKSLVNTAPLNVSNIDNFSYSSISSLPK